MASRAGSAAADKELGLVSLLALGVNGIVGVGIFFTPNLVAGLVPGTNGVFVYVLTAIALVPVALVYAILGARFDRDGGPYIWARAAFGAPAGFFVGWIAYASSVLSTAAIFAGLGHYLGPSLGFSGPTRERACAVLAALLLFGISALGLRLSAWVWTGLTLLKLAPLVLLAALFLLTQTRGVPVEAPPVELAAFARALLIVVFPMQGFEIVPLPGGRVHGKRAVPIATLGSLGLAAVLYMILHAACVSAVPDLPASVAPMVPAGRALGGPALGHALAVGTNLSAIGIAFGMSAMTPRYLSALSGEGGLNAWIGRESAAHVPVRALLLSGLAVVVLLSFGGLSQLFVLSSVAVLTQYAVSACALGKLGLMRSNGLLPKHVWPAPLALVAIFLVAESAELSELWVMVGVVASGALLWFGRRPRPR